MTRALVLTAALWMAGVAFAAETVPTWETFRARYGNFLGSGSQALLPFPELDPHAIAALEQAAPERVFAEPAVYYNAKSWTFTLWRTPDGRYYLDAKGGFWGMDRLVYGPLEAARLQPE